MYFRCFDSYLCLVVYTSHHPHLKCNRVDVPIFKPNKKNQPTYNHSKSNTNNNGSQKYSFLLFPLPVSCSRFLFLLLSCTAGYGYGSQQTTSGAQFQYPPFSGVGETTTAAWSNGTESIAIIGGGYPISACFQSCHLHQTHTRQDTHSTPESYR